MTGAATTIIACFPFVFTKLLNFVGIYGLLLMPVGAIVFVEHWIFPKIGLTRYWAARKKLWLSWPALFSWIIAIAVALFLERTGRLHLFFLFIPTWLLTSVLYTLSSAVAGALEQRPPARTPATETPTATASSSDIKTRVWAIAAVAMLAACIIMSIRVYLSPPDTYEQNFSTFKNLLIWPSLLYFVTATLWAIRHEK